MKKFKLIALVLVSVLLLTGCNLIPGGQTESNTKTIDAPKKGNCKVLDCIQKLDTTVDLDAVTKVMGFEGKLDKEGEGYKVYKWVIDDDKNEVVQVTFYSSSATVGITFSDELIKSSKVDFSKYSEIKEAMNSGKSVTYDEVKEKFGAEGTLIEKTSSTLKYKWVDQEGKYLNATFGKSTGRCTMIIGRI